MIGLIVAACFAMFHSAHGMAEYVIPSFNLNERGSHLSLIKALEANGVIALKNVPKFASTRDAYILSAFACMKQHPNLDALMQKKLQDGTQRTTISMNADGSTFSTALATRCPKFIEAQKSYNQLLRDVSTRLANVLSKDTEMSSPLVDVVNLGAHLDHIHSYTPAPSSIFPPISSLFKAQTQLSLDFHTDNGVMLLTSAPYYFDDQGNVIKDISSGLVLRLSLHGKTQQVMPHLSPDELVVMVGEGFSRWGNFGYKFPPVLHAVQMPQDARIASRLFSGRMILLQNDATLAQSHLSFKDYTDATTRYVLNEQTDDDSTTLSTLGCPVGRTLLASDLSCTLGIWAPSNASDPSTTNEQCMFHCNAPNMKKDVEMCKSLKCELVDEVMEGGTMCWMLCVQHLDTCNIADQVCVDQSLACPPPSKTWEFWTVVAYIAAIALGSWAAWLLWKRCTNPATPSETEPLLG
ncbi:hypothetical protein AC1031_008118 [Aphanomyces cochlioides]|nr:hypothetical protein AC1031_008118 [Aphanomyces cochlioides]